MSSYAQLIYIKLLLLAAETHNKIPLDDNILRLAIRSELSLKEFNKYLDEIKKNFPKFKKHNNFYYFVQFHKYTNYVRNGHAPGLPKAQKRKEHIDIDINIDKDINKKVVDNFSENKTKVNGVIKNLAVKMLSPTSTWKPGRPGGGR